MSDLTLSAAIAGVVKFVVLPESELPFDRDELLAEIKAGIERGKRHVLTSVAITEHVCVMYMS